METIIDKSKTMEPSLNAINDLYNCRTNFTIVGLTGKTAVGCSYLASLMANRYFYEKDEYIRKPEDINIEEIETTDNTDLFNKKSVDGNNKAIANLVFKRKYTICYNYLREYYEPFKIIKYTKVLWLYTFISVVDKIRKKGGGIVEFKEEIKAIIKDKYSPSHKEELDKEYKEYIQKNSPKVKTYLNCLDLLEEVNWDNLYDEIKTLEISIESLRNKFFKKSQELAKYFFKDDTEYNNFIWTFNNKLSKLDYYCFCFFYHRLGVVIRNMGDPCIESHISYEQNGKDTSNIYSVAIVINHIIKGVRKNEGDHCRIVIDSIRNSLEAIFFKERYSAFYLIAVHDEFESTKNHLTCKINKFCDDFKDVKEKQAQIERQIRQVLSLGEIEAKSKDVEKGQFASPNISQCVADAEIHIYNKSLQAISMEPYFSSIGEQWLKYASLIQHPGLITPSNEERCMVVAYTAKFNSGCLSRQVGAVITNSNHSIRTIGWNDVPYGQIPCNLRELSDIVHHKKQCRSFIYSNFEISEDWVYGDESFVEKIKKDYPELLHENSIEGMKGLPYSYCFKTLHNRYLSDKNQVFTRSLHAEENAMMQMVKYGGEPLSDGVIYVTASPCELCCKKLYQIGVRKIVYIDEYPGISRQNIIGSGYKRPTLKQFQGAYGATYFKLYQPFMAYKDEISLRTKNDKHEVKTSNEIFKERLNDIFTMLDLSPRDNYTDKDMEEVKGKIEKLKALNEEKTTK